MNPRISAAVSAEPSKGLLVQSLAMATNADATDESWLSTFGWAKGNPDYDAAAQLGEQWRQDVNRKSLEEMDRRDGRS
ncbi:MAG: hypothetical protein IAE77_28955 [Prosthecobacter sp.]|jgi:hypothetical protein|uniref:hypothetical protein n=1 Tax=Prosthecobacter sp. TaxID=1965333 RepID=UPI001A0F9CC2|nr:hypothetical protein [Prosthecobacter sp.]MBE2287520.1 hypothetical protein [Prosthecobacter sp.]